MLLAVYLIILGVVALSPINPLQGIDLSHELAAVGLGWMTYEQLESTANVALFVPLGLLVALLVPTKWWWIVVVGLALLAGGIELGQALFLPGRVPTLDDVLANTTGGVIGVALAGIIRGAAWAIRRSGRAG